jgi:cation transport ATPase
LAKFKKKKSEPTPDPKDSEKESIKEKNNEIPETESSDSKSETSEPIVNQEEKSEKDKKLNKLFWLRVGFAVIAGTLATFLFENIQGEERRWASIVFMIIVFIVTIFIAKSMKMQLPSSDRKKIVTQGIGSYIFLYLFVWILTYTIVHSSTVSTGIPSPLS